ncbi:Uncharacterised protein [Yersinia enterocolitica]|nr:Uncharacterised protein [Yersinia enterocolitica]
MHADTEPQFGTHDANRHAQVTGRADGNAVLAKELAEIIGKQFAIVIRFRQ